MQKWNLKKTLIGLGLSFTLLFSGTMAVSPNVTHAHAVSARTIAKEVIHTGEHYMGTPYKFGARKGQTRNFDCSSFVQYVFARHGIHLPRTSRQQAKVGRYVSRKNLRPGDLVFFYTPIHHVAIYIGHGKILHTYGRPGVTISNLNSRWWRRHYHTARRVIR